MQLNATACNRVQSACNSRQSQGIISCMQACRRFNWNIYTNISVYKYMIAVHRRGVILSSNDVHLHHPTHPTPRPIKRYDIDGGVSYRELLLFCARHAGRWNEAQPALAERLREALRSQVSLSLLARMRASRFFAAQTTQEEYLFRESRWLYQLLPKRSTDFLRLPNKKIT